MVGEFVKGKTWTTDAVHREPRGNFEKCKAEGYISVEKECVVVQAICDFGNLNALDLYMEMITMFANATQEQLIIIQNTEGYQRVCAVPGSGKTFSIGCTFQ